MQDQNLLSPGPWHVGGNGTIIYDAQGTPVASATVYHGHAQPGTARANAHLLGASYTLLSALEDTLDALLQAEVPAHAKHATLDVVDKARAALAQARSR